MGVSPLLNATAIPKTYRTGQRPQTSTAEEYEARSAADAPFAEKSGNSRSANRVKPAYVEVVPPESASFHGPCRFEFVIIDVWRVSIDIAVAKR
jgi:hypothetical protein